jgi:hypothetical protein
LGTSECRCKHNLPDHKCTCNDGKGAGDDMVAEVVRRVLAALGK